MNLGNITMGNIEDAKKSAKEGARVCAVYDRESESTIRNFIFGYDGTPETIKHAYLKIDTKKVYYDSLEMYGLYDEGKLNQTIREENKDEEELLFFCHEDIIKEHPNKFLAYLQSKFDIIYLL